MFLTWRERKGLPNIKSNSAWKFQQASGKERKSRTWTQTRVQEKSTSYSTKIPGVCSESHNSPQRGFSPCWRDPGAEGSHAREITSPIWPVDKELCLEKSRRTALAAEVHKRTWVLYLNRNVWTPCTAQTDWAFFSRFSSTHDLDSNAACTWCSAKTGSSSGLNLLHTLVLLSQEC